MIFYCDINIESILYPCDDNHQVKGTKNPANFHLMKGVYALSNF